MNRNMTKFFFRALVTYLITTSIFVFVGCQSPNTIPDSHFDKEGHLLAKPERTFKMEDPSRVKFYVEVSGSMNGFFRGNKATDFKIDVWDIISYYSVIAPDVTILTNTGSQGAVLTQSDFQQRMNTGQFVSAASTRVPDMIETIISNLDTDAEEVAVLISDMKYSPVGQAAPDVLLGQYTVNIRNIFAKYGKAISLVGAVSNYLDRIGNQITDRSPYYFFIIGNEEHVAKMRNGISSILESREHFVDNIDNGFNYGAPKFSFPFCDQCQQFEDEPTFVDFDDEEGPAKIKLKIQLEDYRWRIVNEDFVRDAFKIKSDYGSVVNVGEIKVKAENIHNRQLERKASATIELLVSNMPMDMDVLEWSLELPDTEYTLFNEFFENATNENDATKSFSVENFVEGMFYGTKSNKRLETNYILISKVNP